MGELGFSLGGGSGVCMSLSAAGGTKAGADMCRMAKLGGSLPLPHVEVTWCLRTLNIVSSSSSHDWPRRKVVEQVSVKQLDRALR